MVNEEIFGGLKLALSKGESLKQAMMSFYNAGYKKEEIEEAARVLQRQQFQQIQPIQPTPQQPPQQIQPIKPVQQIKPKKKLIQKVSRYETPIQAQIQSSQKIRKGIDTAIKQLKKIEVTGSKTIKQKPVKAISTQKVSTYGEKPKPSGKLITLLLVFFLLLLLGILAAVFFFREELIEILNNLF
ncbi:unnamed protein product [marine sediment metagenome]|uniref:Uncharacterized protein n=1 Tax=marine sediment metagenome TaxID=412755 RepID=X1PJH5_9ZZZZ